MLASGIFAAQEDELANRVFETLGIAEDTALVVEQFGHGQHAGIGLHGSRSGVIDLAISFYDLLVILAGALRLGLAFQRIAQALRGFKLGARGLFFLRHRARNPAHWRQQQP